MAEYSPPGFFQDPDLQDQLLRFVCRDRTFLRDYGYLLTEKDFDRLSTGTKLRSEEGEERQWVAHLSFKYYRQFKEPIGKMLRSEMLMHLRAMRASEAVCEKALFYVERIRQGPILAPEAMGERIRKYRLEKNMAGAMISLQSDMKAGKLTAEQWWDTCKAVVDGVTTVAEPINIFDQAEMEERIERRSFEANQHNRYPFFMIEPLDQRIRGIGRGHLGLVIAPYKRGKSLFLIWLALAYVLQGFNVMYWTLEDPPDDVSDRIDANITCLPIKHLHEKEDVFRDRFARFSRLIHSKLRVYDGTDGQTTFSKIEAFWEQERAKGFTADVVIIDYDDEIKPEVKRDERRHEFADFYRNFRAFLGRHQLIGWSAAQTRRDTEDLLIITGKHIAEDISKIRKATLCLSLGNGFSKWGEKSVYIWVVANRNDKQEVGCLIYSDKERMLFYDRDATMAKIIAEEAAKAAAGVVP